jgi:hypothetical protein
MAPAMHLNTARGCQNFSVGTDRVHRGRRLLRGGLFREDAPQHVRRLTILLPDWRSAPRPEPRRAGCSPADRAAEGKPAPGAVNRVGPQERRCLGDAACRWPAADPARFGKASASEAAARRPPSPAGRGTFQGSLHTTILARPPIPVAEPGRHQLRSPAEARKLADPAAYKLADPAAQKPADPAAHKLADPAAHKLADPAAHKLADPAAHKLADPAAHKLADPAAHKLADPAGRKLADPAARKLADPAARNPAARRRLPTRSVAAAPRPQPGWRRARKAKTTTNRLPERASPPGPRRSELRAPAADGLPAQCAARVQLSQASP